MLHSSISKRTSEEILFIDHQLLNAILCLSIIVLAFNSYPCYYIRGHLGERKKLWIPSNSYGNVLLSSYFIYRMFVAYGDWRIDLSFILMGNVSKYSYFAYAYQDGGKTDEQLKNIDQKK